MNINLENLDKIDTILKKIEIIEKKINGEKRWLNTTEASIYLGYSIDYIHKLKANHFIEGKHYYKKAGKVLFDKFELDNWVISNPISNINPKEIASNVLDDVLKDLGQK